MITVSINGTPYVPDVVSVTDGLNTFTVDLPVTVPSGATVLFNADDAQIEDASGNQLVNVSGASVTISGTAATITSVTAGTVANGQIPLSIAATGYSNGDTVYFVLHDAAQASPDQTEVLAGQASGGGSPLDSGSVVIVSGGITITLAGGIARQNVKVALVIDNGAASNVGVSGAFEVDTVAPTLSTAATDTGGSTWTLTFDEAISGTEDTSDWTVTWTGASGQSVNSVTINGTTSVVLGITGDAPVNGDTGLTVTYSGGDLTDIYGNSLADFGPSTVTNNVSAGGLTTTRLPTSAGGKNGIYSSEATLTTHTIAIEFDPSTYAAGDVLVFHIGSNAPFSSATFNGNAATLVAAGSVDGGSTRRSQTLTYVLTSGDVAASVSSLDLVVTYTANSNPVFVHAHIIEGTHTLNHVATSTASAASVATSITPNNVTTNTVLAFAFGNDTIVGAGHTWSGSPTADYQYEAVTRGAGAARYENLGASSTVTLTYDAASVGTLLLTAVSA